ncbi:hypothetical protein ES703_22323 [subsurface metagenome]
MEKLKKQKKQIGVVVMALLLVPALMVLGLSGSGLGVSPATAQDTCSECGQATDVISSLSENAEANKAVALVLASDAFHSLHRSIQEDGLHFDAGHHEAYLLTECEGHRAYLIYFGFDPSTTGSTVGIIAFVDVSAETILVIARVDQSSPDPQGLRTVTVQTSTGETAEFTITKDIEPSNFDWRCWVNCALYPPPAECLYLCIACLGWPSPWNPFCPACLACMGIQGIACAIACA